MTTRFALRVAGAMAWLLALWLSQPESSVVQASNGWDFYRWPFQYQTSLTMTQGWNGVTSHTSASNLYYAVDLSNGGTSFLVFSADEGVVTCQFDPATSMNPKKGFGFYVRNTHGGGGSLYGHMPQCYFTRSVSIVQGYQIGYSGTTGNSTGIHLHFHVSNNATPFTAKSFSISGYTSFNWADPNPRDCPSTGCPVYTSDNEAAGYDTSLNFYSTIHTAYVNNGGWAVVGSSSYQAGWQPCSTQTPAVLACTQNGHSGYVQTFWGVSGGSYAGRHAVLKGNAYANAVFMSRAILGGYTDMWFGLHLAMWYVGYPAGNSYSIGGGQYRMDFQNGYVIFTQSTCNLKYYYWQTGFGYVLGRDATYCD